MNIKEVSYSEVARDFKNGNLCRLQAVIEEFIQSGHACVEVENYPHKSIESARVSFWRAAQRYKTPHIKVHTVGDKLYLVNNLLIPKQTIC